MSVLLTIILGVMSIAIVFWSLMSLGCFISGYALGEKAYNDRRDYNGQRLPNKSLKENYRVLFPHRLSYLFPSYACGFIFSYYVVTWLTEPLRSK